MADRKIRRAGAVTGESAETGNRYVRYCLVLLLAGAVVLAWLSLLTFSPLDAPSSQVYPPAASRNAAGSTGAYLACALRYWLGGGAYMGLLFATAAAVILIMGGGIQNVPWRITGVALLITATSAAAYLHHAPSAGDPFHGAAGILGTGLGNLLQSRLSTGGAWLVVVVALCIGLMLTVESLVLKIPQLGRKAWDHRSRLRGMTSRCPTRSTLPIVPAVPRAPAVKPQPEEPQAGRTHRPVTAKAPWAPKKAVSATDDLDHVLPSPDLLADPSGGYLRNQEIQAVQKRMILQQTLDDFNVGAQVQGYQTGPVITLFELSLAAGVKVSQVATLADDIARALAVPGVRVVSPLPGRDTIGIEVPNLDKEIVRIKELMALAPEAQKTLSLPLYLGKDAGGDPIIADLAYMPHLLIAGTTGSGKSVCINAIIMAMLMTRRPEDVRLVLVDPKMVEMALFEDIPHLLCPIVNDIRKAEEILEWAAAKMDERYEMLKQANVKNIASFNRLSKAEIHRLFDAQTEEEKERVITHMSSYVIIVDELADLIMTSSKELENHIIRISQKARAVGIHLILATQRPSVNVVTGLIKSNMPCRISFRVAARQESRIVLDQNGAEVLMGRGDMLFLQPGSSNLIRAQGTFVDDSEILAVVNELRRSQKPQYNPELMSIQSRSITSTGTERDELFDRAVEIVLSTQRGSVSLLQRQLQIGYSRASRIIDQMADAGLLGEYKGSQARECMMTLEEWQQLQASIEADRSGASAVNGQPTSD